MKQELGNKNVMVYIGIYWCIKVYIDGLSTLEHTWLDNILIFMFE